MTQAAQTISMPAARPSRGTIVGILLSAGFGLRFGGDKCLARLDSGVEMGLQSAHNLAGAVDRLICVVREYDEPLQDCYADAGFEVATCPDPHLGLSASLRAGLRHGADAAGWLIALADMPWILPSTCEQVADQLRRHGGIVAPWHDGARGHPVGFTTHYADDLLALEGDRGARPLLDRLGESVRLIAVNDPGIHRDIDQPGDLKCAP